MVNSESFSNENSFEKIKSIVVQIAKIIRIEITVQKAFKEAFLPYF